MKRSHTMSKTIDDQGYSEKLFIDSLTNDCHLASAGSMHSKCIFACLGNILGLLMKSIDLYSLIYIGLKEKQLIF